MNEIALLKELGLSKLEQKVVLYGSGAVIGLIGIGLLTGYIQNRIQKNRENALFENADNTDNSSFYVAELKRAFDYWGFGGNTNVDLVFRVLESIKTKKVWEEVKTKYLKIFGKSLQQELQDEFSDTPTGLGVRGYDDVIKIITSYK